MSREPPPAGMEGPAIRPAMPHRRSGAWRRWGRLALAPALLALVILLAGPRPILESWQQADAGWLLAGLASSLVSNLVAAWRWAALSRWLGHPVPLRWAARTCFRAMAVGTLLPGAVVGGDLFRAWALRRRGCPTAAAGCSVLLDRLSGLWILYALAALGLLISGGDARFQLLRQHLQLPPWPVPALGLGLFVTVLLLPLLLFAAWRASGLAPRRLALLRQGGALAQYGLQAAGSFVVQGLSVLALVCAARAFHIGLPVGLVAITALPIFLMAALPLGFGGWGTREAAAAAIWSAFGVAAPAAVAASLAFGVYAVLQAGLGLAWIRRTAEPAPPAAPETSVDATTPRQT